MTLAEFWYCCASAVFTICCLTGSLRNGLRPLRLVRRVAYGGVRQEPVCLQYAQEPVCRKNRSGEEELAAYRPAFVFKPGEGVRYEMAAVEGAVEPAEPSLHAGSEEMPVQEVLLDELPSEKPVKPAASKTAADILAERMKTCRTSRVRLPACFPTGIGGSCQSADGCAA